MRRYNLPKSGSCIVCAAPGLTSGSWCHPCGGFVCIEHDDNLPKPERVGSVPVHSRAEHAAEKNLGPRPRVDVRRNGDGSLSMVRA
jgi:hypothetical protein